MQDTSLPSSKADYINNMPLIARGDGSGDLVTSPTGAPTPDAPCPAEMPVPIIGQSVNVIVEGFGVSRLGDAVAPHPFPLAEEPCSDHIPVCVTASPDVFADGLPVARMGDTYVAVEEEDTEVHPVEVITQSTVFANG